MAPYFAVDFLCVESQTAIVAQARAGPPCVPVAQLPGAGPHPFAYRHHALESHQQSANLPESLKQAVFPRWGNPQGCSTITIVDFVKEAR